MKKMMLWFGFAGDVLDIRCKRLLVAAGIVAFVLTAHAAPPPTVPIFADDFESGTMSLWTTTGINPLDPSTTQNIVPAGGQFSALMNTSIDRMHHNIIADNAGAELSGHTLFTCYIYDLGPTAPATRIFNEVRGYSGGTGLPNGGTAASGSLAQLFAIGKYNTVTLPGEVFTSTKYQGRVTFPTATGGWFNLNAAGSPNRSVGWHRFDIERMPDGTTINFYVDGILSRTFTGATAESWDTVILGPGLGSTVGDAWIDGMSVGRVDSNPPVINCPSNIVAVATSSPGGAVVHYAVTATDDIDPSPTINCTPPSGSSFPVGTTLVLCTATDDAGNISRCTFNVTVLPLRFEGFEHWSEGQAVLTPESNRLVIANLGSGGQDGWRTELKQVQAVLLDFLPFNYLTETCVVVQVEIEKDGQDAQLQTELFLGQDISTVAVDFSPLGSDESDVEVRGPNNQLLNKYRIRNGSRIDIDKIFPPPCVNPPTVYSYFQDTNLVWLKFCKPECGPCIGTNCWIEVVVCITAVLLDPGDIQLKALNVRAQGSMEKTSLTIEDIKFLEFGNEHHVVGDGVVDAADYVVWRKSFGPGNGLMEIKAIDPFHPGGANGIALELLPLSLMGVGPGGGCLELRAQGVVNALPAVQLGMASVRGGQKMIELKADLQAVGATMVQLEVRNMGQPIGRATLPNGVLGELTGDGRLIGAGIISPRDPASGLPTGLAELSSSPGGLAHRFRWDAAMDLRAVDGTMLKGDEFRMFPADPKAQVQSLQMVSLATENIDSFTIVNESVRSAGEQFFPQDVFPPPTATWGNVRGTWDTYGGGGGAGGLPGGGLALGEQRMSFFDVFTALPAVGETRLAQFGTILEANLSMNRGASSECVGFRGRVLAQIMGTSMEGDTRFFDIEILSMDLGVPMAPHRLRESPTLPSHGKLRVRPAPTGGFYMDSFFDVFTELSLDGGTSWVPGDTASMLELMAYQASPFAAPNLPPAMGAYAMQCAPVDYPNQVIIRNLVLSNVSQGPPLDEILIGTSRTVPFSAGVGFLRSMDGGMTWQAAMGNCQGTLLIRHSFDYEGDSYYDTEMLQLNLSGGTIPTGFILRESLTLPSRGRACLGQNDTGQHLIASFFDVFTELSLNGGQIYAPATRPARLTLTHGANECLTIRCPPDQRVWTCDDRAIVNYPSPTATSSCGTVPVIECIPPSGSFFPVGSHTVNCRATDAVGNAAFCSFKVEVVPDSAPPIIVCPTAPVVRWICTNGTPIHFPVTATDDCDTNVTIVCNPPSGSPLPPGDHVVFCDAIDDCGKRDRCQFVISVRPDTEPPRINCSSNIVVWTCDPTGATVGYVVTATDDCDEDVELTCTPPPGHFPPGTTIVTCRAVDGCDKVSTCTFTVTVRVDQGPPRLNCPEKIEICTCSPNGTNVTFNITATDDCDTNVTVVCNPPSGSNFPPGTTSVTCTARDDCGKTSECTFPVTVIVNTVAILCPPDMKAFTCSNTAVVNYNVGAANRCGRSACIAPDNGAGTARLPADCPYTSADPMQIIDGLPAGTTIELAPIFHTFVCDSGAAPCADCFVMDNCTPLDGEIVRYRSTLNLTLNGTGTLAGYNRVLNMANLLQQAQHAPRTPGNPLQSFATDMQQIQGQITGDPDFDLLRITAGTTFGLPSPGHTTLTQLGGGNWAVDSFFDITYRIDFVGRPGGALTGRSGSTTGTIRIRNNTEPTVECNPPSGSSFPIGTTTVTCRATNDCGFSDTCQFKVTVEADQEPPRILCPNGIVEWTCSDGAVVNYTVTATDDYDTNVTITCNPPSGSLFPVGTTIVTCVATDDCGRTDRCEFPVRVIKDTEPPTIICPSNIVVHTCRTNAPVTYHVEARDDCDTNVTIICHPPSGSSFPVGTTTVQCVATDDCGNRGECRFTVTVRPESGPRLTIRRLAAAPGFLVCWPAPSPGWRLQCAPNLLTPNVWQNVTNTPVLIASQWCVTLPNDARHRFYRLYKPCDPVITGVSHLRPHEGDIITITGAGFGQNPNDLCVVIIDRSLVTTNPPPGGDLAAGVVDGVRFIPLRALSAQDTLMTARMGPVPPDAKPGRIMVGHGIGQVGRFQPAFPDILLEDPVWTWNKFGPAGMGEEDVEPQPDPSPTERCFFSGPPANGELCLFIQGDWGTNCYISITARAHDSTSDTGGHDLDAPTVRFLTAGTTKGCVERIVDVLRCAFQQQAGVQIEVTFEEVPPDSGVFKITVRIPGGYIDRGMLTVCVRCPNQP